MIIIVNFTLLQGDCIELLNSFDFKFDMIFADSPYHLSNGGISIQSGVPVSVNKGNFEGGGEYMRIILYFCGIEKTYTHVSNS